MSSKSGLTVVEVIIAMALLALLAAAMVSFLPMLTRTTTAAGLDTAQSQRAISVFEHIARDWSNEMPWRGQFVYVNGAEVSIEAFVAQEMAAVGLSCGVDVISPSAVIQRVTITCDGGEGLPANTLRAEYGDPGA